MQLLPKEHQETIENEEPQESINLLGTIKVPRNLSQLSKTLPKPNYDGSKTFGPKKTKPEFLDLDGGEKALGISASATTKATASPTPFKQAGSGGSIERPIKTKKGDSGGSGLLPNVSVPNGRAET